MNKYILHISEFAGQEPVEVLADNYATYEDRIEFFVAADGDKPYTVVATFSHKAWAWFENKGKHEEVINSGPE